MKANSLHISVVLLAGGQGTRMGGGLAKQFQKIHGKPLALYSFEFFEKLHQVIEIVVVVKEEYQSLFKSSAKTVKFALPGERRQDSSYHGFLQTSHKATHICIHDAARPCMDELLIVKLFDAAQHNGAAASGVQSTSTLKEANEDQFILRTVDRSKIWMIQTPQIIRRDWLFKGFQQAQANNLQVTDDLQLIEPLGYCAKIIEGSEENLKLTYPSDLDLVASLLKREEA